MEADAIYIAITTVAGLVGAIIGGWATLHATNLQMQKANQEADRAALFSVIQKVADIDETVARLVNHIRSSLAFARERGFDHTAWELAEPLTVVRFDLHELYLVFRSDPELVSRLRRLEGRQANHVQNWTNLMEIRSRWAIDEPGDYNDPAVVQRIFMKDQLWTMLETPIEQCQQDGEETIRGTMDVVEACQAIWRKRWGDPPELASR